MCFSCKAYSALVCFCRVGVGSRESRFALICEAGMCPNIFASNFLAELARQIAPQKRRGAAKRTGTFERVPQLLAVAKAGPCSGVRYSVLLLSTSSCFAAL